MATRSFLIVLFLLATVMSHAQDEKKAVQECFAGYKSAIMEDRGTEAVQYVDSRTLEYYTMILRLTKTADSATIDTLPLLDKLMVLSIRHRLTREEIVNSDGKGLLVYAIQKGMVGKNSVANNDVGDITIEDTVAKAQLIANGKRAPFHFHFYKEEGQWKLDLTALFPLAEAAFSQMAQTSGLPENDFLLDILERVTEVRPGSDIWNPVQ